MLNFGLGEILLIVIVGIVVVGPRNLPKLMRSTGQWVAKLRRLSTELRAQSGIDDLIRQEGLEREIEELRALSRVNVLESFVAPGLAAATAPRPRPKLQQPVAPMPASVGDTEPEREREYPEIGCDAYDCLPDDCARERPTPDAAPDAASEAQDPTPSVPPSAETKA